ncbi:MAG: 16S rRNA (guanine(966)-N(2))-methyltransferase RsmD [Acidobacteriota bacterium]
MTHRPAAEKASVRIGAGRWKGRRLPVPAQARPTSDRARQALFNVLGDRVRNARVLDLYAGTGAVGLEAVSRGAASAVLVESDAATLIQSLEGWDSAAGEVRVIDGSASAAMAQLAAADERFDIVFADPPYAPGIHAAAALSEIRRVLAPDGLVVVQADAREPSPELPGLRVLERREYGRNVFHFLGVL